MYQAAQTRYKGMKYNRVGTSGLKLPAVSLGFWHNFGSTAPYENMKIYASQLLIMELHILIWQTIMVLNQVRQKRT